MGKKISDDSKTLMVELLADGMTRSEIGYELSIAPTVVSSYLSDLKVAWRARSDAHLITILIVNGILQVPMKKVEVHYIAPSYAEATEVFDRAIRQANVSAS